MFSDTEKPDHLRLHIPSSPTSVGGIRKQASEKTLQILILLRRRRAGKYRENLSLAFHFVCGSFPPTLQQEWKATGNVGEKFDFSVDQRSNSSMWYSPQEQTKFILRRFNRNSRKRTPFPRGNRRPLAMTTLRAQDGPDLKCDADMRPIRSECAKKACRAAFLAAKGHFSPLKSTFYGFQNGAGEPPRFRRPKAGRFYVPFVGENSTPQASRLFGLEDRTHRLGNFASALWLVCATFSPRSSSFSLSSLFSFPCIT